MYWSIVGRTEVEPQYLSQIKQAAKQKHLNANTLVRDEFLLEKLTLFLTYHTNTIEGSTMTLDDVRTVLDDDDRVLSNKTAREQAEARNHRSALYYLIEQLHLAGKKFQWTEDLVLNIHLRLMNSIVSNAGQYRNHGVRIRGAKVVLANYLKIPKLMDQLLEQLNQPAKDQVGQMAEVHARFEQIHPFSDGNGRTGRLVMLGQALQHNLVPPLIVKERRHAYYKYLEIAQTEEYYDLLGLFIAESMLAEWG
jgi:Fic family protein